MAASTAAVSFAGKHEMACGTNNICMSCPFALQEHLKATYDDFKLVDVTLKLPRSLSAARHSITDAASAPLPIPKTLSSLMKCFTTNSAAALQATIDSH